MTGLYGKPAEDRYWATPDFKLMRDAVKDQADLIAISDADQTDITLGERLQRRRHGEGPCRVCLRQYVPALRP